MQLEEAVTFLCVDIREVFMVERRRSEGRTQLSHVHTCPGGLCGSDHVDSSINKTPEPELQEPVENCRNI